MYAIVEIAGQQFKAEKGRKLYVHRLPQAEGQAVSFNSVMLIERDGKVLVGAPIIKDAAVEVSIIKHLKDDKVIIFKKKRRKGYRVKNGHRQALTQIIINDIVEGKVAAPKTETKAPAKPKTEKPVTEAKETKPKAPAKPKAPKTEGEAKPKPAAKKPVTKKPAVKKPVVTEQE